MACGAGLTGANKIDRMEGIEKRFRIFLSELVLSKKLTSELLSFVRALKVI